MRMGRAAWDGLRQRYSWSIGLALAALISVGFIVMREIDSLLLMVASAGGERYGMAALADLHGSSEPARQALTFWAQTAQTSGPLGTGARSFEWVRLYALFDSIVTLAYMPIVVAILRRLQWQSIWRWLVAGLLLAFDLIENVLTYSLASFAQRDAAIVVTPPDPHTDPLPLANQLYKVGILKWLVVWLIIAMIIIGLVRVRLGLNRVVEEQTAIWWRVLWRLRVQVGVVAVLAVMMALPSNDRLGPLQQLPDVLRSYLAPRGVEVVAATLSSLALLAVGAAIWVSASWLPFAAASNGAGQAERGQSVPGQSVRGWSWPYRAVGGLAVFFAVLFVVQVIAPPVLAPLGVAGAPPWASRWQIALPSLAASVLLGATWWLHNRYGRDAACDPEPIPWHPRYGHAINLLAVTPIVLGGLGLLRAAVGLALLPGAAPIGLLGIAEGVLAAVVIGPFALHVLQRVTAGQTRARATRTARPSGGAAGAPSVGPITTGLALGLAAAAVIALGAFPVQLAPWLGLPGILAVAMGVTTLVLGGLVAISFRSRALALDLITLDRNKPIAFPAILLVIALFGVIHVTDKVDTYHEVTYLPTTATPTTRTLSDHFKAWQQAMQDCHTNVNVPAAPRVQPLVLVSAAGGGIRAAYWTEKALLQLSGAITTDTASQARCRHDSVFLVSSVSGGSVGAALWSEHPTGELADPTIKPYASAIAGTDALSALGASLLFRDSVRAIAGLDFRWPDRAWAMQRVWSNELASVGVDFDAPFLPADQQWHPITLLNGTDLQTGCRVVIAPIQQEGVLERPGNCQAVPHEGAKLPGAYYAAEFLETSKCDEAGTHTMSTSVAALLSARFPFVTPTGLMYACRDSRHEQRIQVGDGGYLENSGIQAGLQVWRAIEPLVAAHNREVLDSDPASPAVMGDALIVPVFVVVGNSYRSEAGTTAAQQPELLAPLAGRNIAAAGLAPPRLETELRDVFSRPIPGTDKLVDGEELATRVVVIAPSLRPEITAPLGWALSSAAQDSLTKQMASQVTINQPDTNLPLLALRDLMPGAAQAGTTLDPWP